MEGALAKFIYDLLAIDSAVWNLSFAISETFSSADNLENEVEGNAGFHCLINHYLSRIELVLECNNLNLYSHGTLFE
jgi:hypothetical protein